MNSEDHLYAQLSKDIGEIIGKLSSLVSTVNGISSYMSEIDNRLRQSEKEVVKIAVKIGLLGIVAGGIGTFLMHYAAKHI